MGKQGLNPASPFFNIINKDNCIMTERLTRYAELLDELFDRRCRGTLTVDEEEEFAKLMNDCRDGMALWEEEQIQLLVAERRKY
jgi:hypothetical protein